MKELFSKRGNKIIESTAERVSARIDDLAQTWKEGNPYRVAYRDGAPDGVLQFYLLHENFSFASREEQEAFLNTLCIEDDIITLENSRLVTEPGSDTYIEVERRKELK
jgi:hypothetical protein